MIKPTVPGNVGVSDILRNISPQICITMSEPSCQEETTAGPSQAKPRGWGSFRSALELFSCRVLGNTPSVKLDRHKAKDGDVLMHSCQKIPAQLFSAKSHTGLTGEKLNATLRRVRTAGGGGSNEHLSFTVCSPKSCLRDVKIRLVRNVRIENVKQSKQKRRSNVIYVAIYCFIQSVIGMLI